MRDHLLGWPGMLALIDTEAKPSRRTPERVRVVQWFVADCRTCDSDKPQRDAKPATNIEPGCFGVWRKTPPPVNVELKFRSPWTGEIKSTWPGGGWADGWEWFDTSAEPEKPAQAEPQADAEGWIAHKPGPCPVKEGVMLEHKVLRDGGIYGINRHRCDPSGPAWMSGAIVAYRMVSA